jgi:DNA repair exonuclease SbcCD ATPase subunit
VSDEQEQPEVTESPEQVGMLRDLQAERAKRQELEKALADVQAAQEKREREDAEKAGEYQRLYEELSPRATELEERVKAYEAQEAARTAALVESNAKRIEALPKHLRAVVDALPDSIGADAVARQLAALEAMKATSSVLDSPSKGSQPGGLTKEQEAFRDRMMPGASDEAVKRTYAASQKVHAGRR